MNFLTCVLGVGITTVLVLVLLNTVGMADIKNLPLDKVVIIPRLLNGQALNPEICVSNSITTINCFKISHCIAVFNFTEVVLCLSFQTS